jgi:hypothetical protein
LSRLSQIEEKPTQTGGRYDPATGRVAGNPAALVKVCYLWFVHVRGDKTLVVLSGIAAPRKELPNVC